MFIIALTGGIASGKSTVARYFSKLGVTIIDADEIARELVDKSPELSQQITTHFGSSVLTNNKLDRAKLRDIIFADSKQRYWLEQLLHPLIYREIQRCVQNPLQPYCIVVIPLLFESNTAVLLKEKPVTNNYISVNRILCVTTSRELQVQRAHERDHLEKDLINRILSVQISSQEGIKRSDDIIYNDSTLQSLHNSIETLHANYLSLARTQNNFLEQSPFLGYYLAFK